jgi:hypothetical protein
MALGWNEIKERAIQFAKGKKKKNNQINKLMKVTEPPKIKIIQVNN